MCLEKRAEHFARRAHGEIGHLRKYIGEPYAVHLEAVAELVRGVPHTKEMLAAAWLHDVIEDTPTLLADVEAHFGIEVTLLVGMLTDISRPTDGNRAIRKALDREYLRHASPAAKTIKLADLIDNTRSITRHDPKFARVYLMEKRLLLGVLAEGDRTLFEAAKGYLYVERAMLRLLDKKNLTSVSK